MSQFACKLFTSAAAWSKLPAEASLTIAAAAVCAFAAKTDEAQLPMYQPNRSFREPQSLIDAEALFCEGG
jgi:hypothetical protein